MVAKSSEQSSEQSENNCVYISRKDLDDHKPVDDENTKERALDSKNVEEGMPDLKNQVRHRENLSFPSAFATKRPKKWSYSSLMVVMLVGNLSVFTDVFLQKRFKRSF